MTYVECWNLIGKILFKFVILEGMARLLLSLPQKVPLQSALKEFLQVFVSEQVWVRCIEIVLKNPLLNLQGITSSLSHAFYNTSKKLCCVLAVLFHHFRCNICCSQHKNLVGKGRAWRWGRRMAETAFSEEYSPRLFISLLLLRKFPEGKQKFPILLSTSNRNCLNFFCCPDALMCNGQDKFCFWTLKKTTPSIP